MWMKPCEPRAIYVYQDHNINPFYTCKSTGMANSRKKECMLQLYAQTAINQRSSHYWIHMNQYVYISELNKITKHRCRNVHLIVERKKDFLHKIIGIHHNDFISVVSLNNPKIAKYINGRVTRITSAADTVSLRAF